MVRKTFFSFHYERDIWRANVVRNSWYTKDRESAGFWDSSLWENSKKKGASVIKRMIDNGLIGTSVTVVLIGRYTAEREWVLYEIEKSYERGNGLLGVYIHGIKNRFGHQDIVGKNPFGNLYIGESWNRTYFSEFIPTYLWKWDNGYNNLGFWIEDAAQKVGR